MSDRIEVVLAGTGGQGIILAAVALAEAAATYDGRNAAQTQSYGPAARGGTCKAEVVISSEDIDYPKVTRADVLLAMSQNACDEFAEMLKEDGLLIVDSTLVSQWPMRRVMAVPITRLAEEKTGRSLSANMVGLGILVGLTGAASAEAVEASLRKHVPEQSLEVNLEAYRAGMDVAGQLAREHGLDLPLSRGGCSSEGPEECQMPQAEPRSDS